ncbi:MAG: hypothetical protein KIT33_13765 [Candidatus Kapabacteria bacterium]|nr:hypothetical protein [Ignavibacteriota bacterium]MCW5886032.1 hypothetical protein [Candidatus Kapabacteria bacterium]
MTNSIVALMNEEFNQSELKQNLFFQLNENIQINSNVIFERPLNSINLNFLGDASLISFNYERAYFFSQNFFIATRIGIGVNTDFRFCIGSCPPQDSYTTIPHGITASIGKERHYFEMGMGGTYINGNEIESYLLYPIIAYRIHPMISKDYNFRIYIQFPIAGEAAGSIVFIPIGLSFGLSF